MDNLIQDYWTQQMSPTANIIVGIIGLGPTGLALAECFSQKYTVYAFDAANHLESLQSITNNIPGNILWTEYPNDLCAATHIIIAEPFSAQYTRGNTDMRLNDLLWATGIARAAIACGDQTDVTIVVANIVLRAGDTRPLLEEFVEQGHKVGVAPEVSAQILGPYTTLMDGIKLTPSSRTLVSTDLGPHSHRPFPGCCRRHRLGVNGQNYTILPVNVWHRHGFRDKTAGEGGIS